MGKNSNKDKESLKAKLGKAAGEVGAGAEVKEVKKAVEENTTVDSDAIQEAIQLEDREEGYNSSAQAEEEDALLREFGF